MRFLVTCYLLLSTPTEGGKRGYDVGQKKGDKCRSAEVLKEQCSSAEVHPHVRRDYDAEGLESAHSCTGAPVHLHAASLHTNPFIINLSPLQLPIYYYSLGLPRGILITCQFRFSFMKTFQTPW